MILIIKKNDLFNMPCSKYDNLPNCKFDATKKITIRRNHAKHVSWLIASCKLAQTTDMLEYFKSCKPLAESVSWLIKNCEFARTAKMLKYYKSLSPSAKNVSWLFTNCRFIQTTKMLEYFKSLNPLIKDIHWLINNCKFARSYLNKKEK